MKTLSSLKDLVKELRDRPYALYYLYRLYTTGREETPNFFDRIRIVKFLRKEKLIEPTVGKKKHLHIESNRITPNGVEICVLLNKTGYFEILRNIPLNSKEAFNAYYFGELIEIDKYSKYPESIIYPILSGNINKYNGRIHSKIEITIKKLILIDLKDNIETWKIIYDLKCLLCKESTIQEIMIEFNIDNINRNPFKITCSKCNSIYFIGSFLDYAYDI